MPQRRKKVSPRHRSASSGEQRALAELEHQLDQRRQQLPATRPPKKLAESLSRLMARTGYGRVQETRQIAAAWSKAAGQPLAAGSRAGSLRRAVLEIRVANSTLLQEAMFAKQQLLSRINEELPDHTVTDLRFRVGPID